ncbi:MULTISPECIES: serine/threonine protein kinase [unclassified Methylobacterium]|uniref:serine/threonine-protein kinase n=1 Tax=unclassified Methylobacterium TaxID=2615210 RepID=UPI00226A7C5B|nr:MULTISPECIES: serine/threonine protein kinase [unclassified Methylobacterium]
MREERTVIDAGRTTRVGPGTRLSDLYEIDAPIATGGMGEVFRGHAIETGDTVAIKVLRADFEENDTALTLFRKEASALHHVHHGAVVRYFVFAIDRRLGLPFLAMEYVTGESLAERLKQGPLAFEAVDTLRRRLAGGLGAAHEAGIVHRDVTPDNIIIPAGDPARAKLIDFGIARLAETRTVIGDGFAGKYAYVSPEQCGLQGGEITPRSDIYSLGLVLAEASRGRPLDMVGGQTDFIAKRTSIPDLTGVAPQLVPLLERMLQPDPRLRPQSMAEVEGWIAQTPTRDPRPNNPRTSKRGRLGLAIGGTAAALVIGLAAMALLWPERKPSMPDAGPPLEETPRPAPRPTHRPVPGRVPETVPGPGPAPSDPQADTTRMPPAAPRPDPEPRQPEPSAPPAPPAPQRSPRTGPEPTPIPLPNPDATQEPTIDPPPPEQPPVGPTMERVAAYIHNYRGGACFFLSPTSVSAKEAVVEGYGTTTRPFADFDAAFKKALGFEAKIQLRQIEPGQCGLVDLLARQARAKTASVPKLRLDKDRLRSGEELRGNVDLGETQNVTVLLVEGDGTVHDLARYLKRTGRRATFAVRLDIPASGAARTQLVVAAGGLGPIDGAGPADSPVRTIDTLARAIDLDPGFGLAVHQIKVGN